MFLRGSSWQGKITHRLLLDSMRPKPWIIISRVGSKRATEEALGGYLGNRISQLIRCSRTKPRTLTPKALCLLRRSRKFPSKSKASKRVISKCTEATK